MKFNNWKTETIDKILPEEFFKLISKNKTHIEKTFPVTVSSCLDLEKTTNFINNNIQKQGNKENYFFYIRNNETNNLIGYVCIKNIKLDILKCELAYFVDVAFEGQGIISKAVSQTIEFCFDELRMNKIFICTSKVNKASQQIALKHKFKQEGILREEFKNHEGVLEDIVYFGLLKSDYQNEK
ncbi:MAG: GNAT family N-acetyltransferase [Flavobacterium sp.]|nr:GNAT family N-acetyltransferase [Flavobacterium sp.]